jgi:hypothetical protein
MIHAHMTRLVATLAIVTALFAAVGCSAKTTSHNGPSAGATYSPTPTPSVMPKLKVSPYEPTI